jgi:hypothetical protein
VLQEATIDTCTCTTTQTPTASGLIDVGRRIEPDHDSPRREPPAPLGRGEEECLLTINERMRGRERARERPRERSPDASTALATLSR